MYGLLQRDIDYILKTLEAFPEVKKAALFGSRALGNYKKGSDIDLSLFGAEIDHDLVIQINSKLNEEVPIPYFVDVVDFKSIRNKKLQEHIERQGIIIYEKVQ